MIHETSFLPFTSHKAFAEFSQVFERAEGMYYWTPEGHKVLDACSGLFCSSLGHGHKSIAKAAYDQMLKLDYSSSFQRAHTGLFDLSDKLSSWTPDDLNKIFYASSGSGAVDSALKFALAYHHSRGDKKRTKFVSRDKAYHGVNFGGVGLSGLQKNRDVFEAVVQSSFKIRNTWSESQRFCVGRPNDSEDFANDLLKIIEEQGAENIAACVLEPIAGSFGFFSPPVGYLESVRKICSDHGILLIFDEVITGIGKTGSPFASQTFGVTPDLIVMAKSLTNGMIPMSAIAVRDKHFDCIKNNNKDLQPDFFHGYTYSGHPVAAAAALETLNVIERENYFEKIKVKSLEFTKLMLSLREIDLVTDIRCFELMCGIDLKPIDKSPGLRGYLVQADLFKSGIHVKPTGDTILLNPAYISSSENFQEIHKVLESVFKKHK